MYRFTLRSAFLSACILVIVPAANATDDFPQWRGPNRDGLSPDKGLLKEWPEAGPAIAWETDQVGIGYSSVAIKDGVLVTMGDLNGVEHIIAVSVSDGSRLWAVQPEPVAAALADRVDLEFAKMDRDRDGKVDELEALASLGWNFHQYDNDEGGGAAAERAARVFAALDVNMDNFLDHAEAGNQLREHFQRADLADPSSKEELANRRATALISEADENRDGAISRQEARKNYLDRIFNQADQRDPETKQSDKTLTRQEVLDYLSDREGGKDGALNLEELQAYYRANVVNGDGMLSRDEIGEIYGGYRNGMGDGPRGTPTIDNNRVYAEGGNGDVTCLDLETGTTLWHKNLKDDLGGGRPGWGYSESPLIVQDWVIVTPGGKNGTLAALDKLTGQLVWQSKENTEAAHYSSPIFATISGIPQIVQFARESVFGVAVEDGKLLWKYSGANNGTANCCTPIVDQNHVFVASAYGTGGGLARVFQSGDSLVTSEVYFEKKMGIHHGGIVKIDDHLYSNGAGSLICMNFLTGEIAWQNRSVGKGSLVAADGMLYVLSEKQELALVEATPEEYRERGRLKLEKQGRPSWAHPVVIGGRLYIRDQQRLTAFEVR